MEKVLLELWVNQKPSDCVISLSERAIKNEEGENVWEDDVKKIAKAKKYPYNIDVFVHKKDNQYDKVTISAESVKRLYAEIQKIEATECVTDLSDC